MKLYFHVTGHGQPLIILHGLFGSGDNWYTLSNFFGEKFRVWAVDQRNHGRSPHSDTFDYRSMAADIDDLMIHEGISSACFIGHSMGGKTAMEFALTHQEKVERLVVVDISPRSYPPQHDAIFEAMFSLDLAKYQTRSELDAALSGKIQEYPVRQLLLKNVARDENSNFKWKIDIKAIHKNYSNVNAAISSQIPFEKPTLFLRGSKSKYITDEDTPAIKSLFPHASFAVVENAGHWVHAEAPGEFGRIVMEFLTHN